VQADGIEMGLTPANEAKAGVPQLLPRTNLDDMISARRRLLKAVSYAKDDDDGPWAFLKPPAS
jgi:hypothetical protein